MGRNLAALLCGLLFGVGLAVAQMTNPMKVLAFLDIFGDWDPSLAFVMGGALAVMLVGYPLVRRRGAPLFDSQFHVPTRRDLDARLIGGSALFGIGWGIAGYCPGPVIAALGFGITEPLLFVAAMLAGAQLQRLLMDRS
ncbi:MAG: YeeE/YedE family protein [Chromatiales bacterium]|nr:YeeE/YedE family protein [Chromatiales bacterium]